MAIEDPEIDEADRKRRYNKNRIEDQEVQVYSMFLAAAMAGGLSAKKAVREADDAMSVLKQRFT